MTDMVLAGRVFGIEKKSGISQSGNEWVITKFNLTRVKQRKDQNGNFSNYEETLPCSGFGDFNLVEKGIYQIGANVKLKQSQNGGAYKDIDVQWVEPIQLPTGAQPAQQAQAQPAPQKSAPQEDFSNDDIPF